MKYFDLHADTILHILQQGDASSLYENPATHVDLKRLQEGNALAQSFVVWLPNAKFDRLSVQQAFSPTTPAEDLAYIDLAVARLQREIAKHSNTIAWAKSAKDIRENAAAGRISAILTLEDARAVDNSLEKIERFYDQGFQMIGLIWNEENCFGYPNSADAFINAQGLKPFGMEAVAYMDELGIIIDVSHLNDGGIADVLKLAKNPVVASHSNAREMAMHSRNLADVHIRGIAETGGVVGICIAPGFLRTNSDQSTIEDMVRHLNHIYQVGGEEVLAIGTDFDGTSGEIELDSPAKMPRLFEALDADGWPIARIEKLAYQNAMRIFDKD